jgi:inhibitor of KinA sporulation pathway (predicted exonuclease)
MQRLSSPGLLNVIDVEATCWDGPVPPGQSNEIIEIGLCVVDLDKRDRIERAAIMVKPQHSTVSAFCTQLTSLTSADLVDGLTFEQACALLVERYGARDHPWASWGDYDRKQFAAQCEAGGVPYPFGPIHINAKAVFGDSYALSRRPGMARALITAGLPLEGRHHRGVDDAWNIAALVLHLADRGAWTGDSTAPA